MRRSWVTCLAIAALLLPLLFAPAPTGVTAAQEPIPHPMPQRTALTTTPVLQDIVAVSAGYYHTCAVTTGDGVRCWGYNYDGQLGDGTRTDRPAPVDLSGLSSGVSAVSAGYGHTCAVTTGGGVQCWGFNASGQLGDGTTTDRLTPMTVVDLSGEVAAIAAGYLHTCAVTAGGGVQCWGNNISGRLGDGTTTNRPTPVDVSGLGSGVSAIAVGDAHTCALTAGGGVQCWGRNDNGQLGDGTTTTDRLTPVTVAGLSSGVSAIAAGEYHTCAVTAGGGVQCWGDNWYGQLGDGTTTDRLAPVDVNGLSSGVSAVSAGYGHTCALTTNGGVQCWGNNYDGQLGDGTTTNRSTPVDVSGLSSGVTAITAGSRHTCALMAGGGVRCWGDNASGQLGTGVVDFRTTPGTVVDTGAAPTEHATGRVTLADGRPLSGVTVAAGAVEAVTDAGGTYTVTGLLTGTYTLTATYPGYTFTPPTQPVTLPPAVTGVDFLAALAAPPLDAIANADGDGSYTVSWGSVTGATGYTLEEAPTSSFSGATTVYSGTATSHTVVGQASGTYVYRVKATDARGDSAWSAPQSVLVWHRVFLPLSLRE